MTDAFAIVKHPLATEKAIRTMESENKLTFVVEYGSTKAQIKKAVVSLFSAKVIAVRTYVTAKGQKRAVVTFHKDTPAIDIATDLGVL